MPRRMYTHAAALFAAGAVIGGIVAGTVGASAASPSPSPSTSPSGPHRYGAGPGMWGGHDTHGMRPFGLPQSGTVSSVDAGAKTVTIQTANGTKTYGVDGNSDIDKNGEATLSDLKAGDKVRFAVRPGTSTIAVLHAGTEALNLPRRGPGHGRGHCDGDGRGPGGPSGPGGGEAPAPSSTATPSSST